MSYIKFTDDTLFFVKTESHLWFLIQVLNSFCQISGLMINMKKSALLGFNCGEEEEELAQEIGWVWERKMVHYLSGGFFGRF